MALSMQKQALAGKVASRRPTVAVKALKYAEELVKTAVGCRQGPLQRP